jgi:hypothetical protein
MGSSRIMSTSFPFGYHILQTLAEPYTGTLPKGYSLVCPHCRYWKAYPFSLGKIKGIKCAGPATEKEKAYPNATICGKFTSLLQVNSYIGIEMVKD